MNALMSNFARAVLTTKPKKEEPLNKDGSKTGGKSGAQLATYNNGLKAVIKAVKKLSPQGKPTQRGIKVSSHPRREVAFYKLARLLGFESIAPEVVLLPNGSSAQMFMPASNFVDFNSHLQSRSDEKWLEGLRKVASLVPREQWRMLLILDIIAASRDRHSNNLGLQLKIQANKVGYGLMAWDNACTFGLTFEKYHNVFHKYLFRQRVDLDPFWPKLEKLTRRDFTDTLGDNLTTEEIDHAYLRLQFMLEFPYRLPFQIMSKGEDDNDKFPSYASYFSPLREASDGLLMVLNA